MFEMSTHLLHTSEVPGWYIGPHIDYRSNFFCNLYQSLEECSEIVPETKPPPLLFTSFTIYYLLQLGHQKLAQIVPSPFRQANATHTTPRALQRLH